MNVARSTQLELLLITKTLDIITTTPGLSVAKFFEEFIEAVNQLPDSSLSTYWKEIYKDSLPDFPNRISLVDVKPPETKEGPAEVVDTIVPDISELDYLRTTVGHSEIRHDPLLLVRKLYDTASSSLLSTNDNAERSILLYSCLILASKSSRLSLLLHTIALLYIFRDESDNRNEGNISDPAGKRMGIKKSILKKLVSRAKELFREHKVRFPAQKEELQKKIKSKVWEKILASSAFSSSSQTSTSASVLSLETIRNSLVLSFGKADHGIPVCLFCCLSPS
jgi:hypothetical protein